MTATFRKYLSLFLLSIFAWPLVEKGIHDFSHADDEHCTSRTAYHIHDQQHQCSLCDLDITSPLTPSHTDDVVIAETPVACLFYFHPAGFVPSPHFSFSLRGPPLA
jgi:hypothetical protein